MSTVRRLYFYAMTLISLEVIVWGVVNLLRTVISRRIVGSGSLLATGLSLVLVGIPIFWLHWRTAQRDARRDEDERSSRVRAVFLYAVLAATAVPMVYAVLAALHRELTVLLGGMAYMAWFGGEGSLADNLAAVLVNAVAFVYFWTVLRNDWRADVPGNYLVETRRLYRYLWMLFGLMLTVVGVYHLLQFLFLLPGTSGMSNAVKISGMLSLLVIGVPLWLYHWNGIQFSLVNAEERRSQLRLVVLYLIVFSGVVGVIGAGGRVLSALIRWAAGEPNTLGSLLRGNSAELAAAIALGVMWWYYGRVLRKELAALPDLPQREGLARLYDYLLALLGLAVTYAGIFTLIEFIGRMLFYTDSALETYRDTLGSGLSALLVGLPVWWIPWREMQREAGRRAGVATPGSSAAGLPAGSFPARRSVLRKSYLYLVVFLLMIGVMSFAGRLLYLLLNALLARPEANLAYNLTTLILTLAVTVGLLVYHFRILREDNRLAQQAVGSLHAAYPTLILIEEGETPRAAAERAFANHLVEMLGRSAPRLPVAVHSMERGAPDEAMLEAKAVVLPAVLVIEPPEPLRLWLNEFRGLRVLIPFARDDWHWLGQPKKQPEELAREAATSLRQIAEGGSARSRLTDNPWAVAGYILGGIFALILLVLVVSILLGSLIS